MANAAVAEPRPKAAEPASHGDDGAYLLSKGWKCLGNPASDNAIWLDPSKPLVAHYTEEPCTYEQEIREEYVEDGKVKIRYRTETRQIMVSDGSNGGNVKAARRQVYHPKCQPLNVQQALWTQLGRDALDALKAEEARRKAVEAKK